MSQIHRYKPYKIKSVHLLVMKVIITKMHGATHIKFIRVIILGKLIWTGFIARIGERRSAYRVLVGKLEKRIPLERPQV
jgi:hypothetical protein